MAGVVWHWTNGDKEIFTKRIDTVDKAMQEGYYVMPMMVSSHIFKPSDVE
ncbi:MAG: hypothetical protein JSW00_05480 [Thermoplasmata archaeon]|nr:MAG: hypothetical protein JSW00_05480 [Thermoplasmata archaeon]